MDTRKKEKNELIRIFEFLDFGDKREAFLTDVLVHVLSQIY